MHVYIYMSIYICIYTYINIYIYIYTYIDKAHFSRRCWAYETALAAGETLPNKIPFCDYYEYHPRPPSPLSSKCGTYMAVNAGFWPWLSGENV